MTETTFRAVFRRDPKTTRYEPAGHNFTVQQAEERAARLQDGGFATASAVQTLRHKGRGFKNCDLCKTAAENFSELPDAVAERGREDASTENT